MEDVNIKMENAEILMDLIVINQERTVGYAKAITILDSENDSDLISIFENNSQQAQQFKSQLIPLVHREDTSSYEECDPDLQKTYRTWLENVEVHTDEPRKTVLIAVTKGEEENLQIYRIALANLEVMEDSAMEMIRSQAQLQAVVYQNLKDLLILEMAQE